MKFSPTLNNNSLLQPAIYNFTVEKAEEIISKKGQNMLKVTLSLRSDDGDLRYINDYLHAGIIYKLHRFAETLGLDDKFKNGEITPFDCVGKHGTAEVAIQPSQQKPDGGYFAAKNVIKTYLKAAHKNNNTNNYIDF